MYNRDTAGCVERKLANIFLRQDAAAGYAAYTRVLHNDMRRRAIANLARRVGGDARSKNNEKLARPNVCSSSTNFN